MASGDTRIYLEFEVRRVACRGCGQVKRERLAFLADNTHYTERFAYYVGRRCRAGTVQDVAKELHLDWHAVKDLEKQYMRAQLARPVGQDAKAIGIDEISIRKGHDYRIVVSDLDRKRPIWFGGADRKEESMANVLDWLGEKKTRRHSLGRHGHVEAVLQRRRWRERPQAAILFDKFHIMRHLGEALDKVRK